MNKRENNKTLKQSRLSWIDLYSILKQIKIVKHNYA